MGVPGEVNEAALRLFSAVAFDAAFTSRDEIAKDLLEIEHSLLFEYQVAIKPEAFYAAKQIEAHVRRTMRPARELSSTAYRRWTDDVSRTRDELMRNQLVQYMSTCGTLRTGLAYIPATVGFGDIHPPDEEWKITAFGTLEQAELREKCRSLISEGTALSHQTVLDCLAILDWTKAKPDVSKVRNQEARALLAARHLEDTDREPEEDSYATSDPYTDGFSAIEHVHLLATLSQKLDARMRSLSQATD